MSAFANLLLVQGSRPVHSSYLFSTFYPVNYSCPIALSFLPNTCDEDTHRGRRDLRWNAESNNLLLSAFTILAGATF
jgi:hypothetical protein